MKKITALLLAAALVGSGCGIIPDYYDDPFATPIEYSFGYYRHSPMYYSSMYYWPVSYTYGCRGYYAPDGSCYYYPYRYVGVPSGTPEERPVIPESQPRVMATDVPWAYTNTDNAPRYLRGRTSHEPGVSSARRMARPEPRVRSRPETSSRPARSTRSTSSPPRRSTPRQASTRSKPPVREPVRVEEKR